MDMISNRIIEKSNLVFKSKGNVVMCLAAIADYKTSAVVQNGGEMV